MSFKLVYGKEAVVPLHFRVYVDMMAKVLKFDLAHAKQDQLYQLSKLEDERMIALHH
jgi:hypothetical protein